MRLLILAFDFACCGCAALCGVISDDDFAGPRRRSHTNAGWIFFAVGDDDGCAYPAEVHRDNAVAIGAFFITFDHLSRSHARLPRQPRQPGYANDAHYAAYRCRWRYNGTQKGHDFAAPTL